MQTTWNPISEALPVYPHQDHPSSWVLVADDFSSESTFSDVCFLVYSSVSPNPPKICCQRRLGERLQRTDNGSVCSHVWGAVVNLQETGPRSLAAFYGVLSGNPPKHNVRKHLTDKFFDWAVFVVVQNFKRGKWWKSKLKLHLNNIDDYICLITHGYKNGNSYCILSDLRGWWNFPMRILSSAEYVVSKPWIIGKGLQWESCFLQLGSMVSDLLLRFHVQRNVNSL